MLLPNSVHTEPVFRPQTAILQLLTSSRPIRQQHRFGGVFRACISSLRRYPPKRVKSTKCLSLCAVIRHFQAVPIRHRILPSLPEYVGPDLYAERHKGDQAMPLARIVQFPLCVGSPVQ